ncbi:hypothetical protein SL1157_1687 [Ruegeria lacuscaerulensis ITI-1157]|nr:hypothetical protein SL1157_1687 [Ruegeria lacuscaerulensis ITI-1157]
MFQKFGALPKMAEYAALHLYPYNDEAAGAGKDISADFYVLISACEAVVTWITDNIPAHDVDGVRYLLISYFGDPNGRTPQQREFSTVETAPLVALIDDLLAAIENIVAQPV